MKKNPIKEFMLVLAFLFCVIGLCGFILAITCEVLIAFDVRLVSNKLILPLSNLNTYDVDEDGKICCYLGTYHRIQLYDSDGKLLKGWFLRSHRNGEIYIEGDSIYFADYDDNYFVFNLAGEQIENEKIAGKRSELKSKKEIRGRIEDNYMLKNTIWDSRIIRVSDAEEKVTIVKTPIFLLPFRFLTPCLIITVIGAGILYFLRKDILDAVEENSKKSQAG